MITIKQTLTREGVGFTVREWRPLIKSAWERTGQYWHKAILPKHFTFMGAREYGYAPRSIGYMIRKARVMGHRRPLVWSGTSERLAKRIRNVRATPEGARVVVTAPALNFWRKTTTALTGASPNMRRELMAISVADSKLLAARVDRTIQTQVDAADRGGERRLKIT